MKTLNGKALTDAHLTELAAAQARGEIAAVVDTARLDRARATVLGVDVAKLLIGEPSSPIQGEEIVTRLERSGAVDLCVWIDSRSEREWWSDLCTSFFVTEAP